jgi:hypothetical protein
VIQRQQIPDEVLDPGISRKLERFRNRWSRLNRAWFPEMKPGTDASEPSFFERMRHQIIGKIFCAWDDMKRALFEFLPLDWLRAYRETAQWFFAGRDGAVESKVSWRQQIAAHWPTILVSYLLVGVTATLSALNPHLNYLPFYMIPCAALTLIINRRWGCYAALISAGIGPALLGKVEQSFAELSVFIWNTSMRFLLLQFVVLLIDRIRREASSAKAENS